ncbi:MAG TPA: RNA-binding domain-containing protein [Candidatus Methanoperedens sp.]|nr:RNA-binding domain-containing protein [Candidatus Methanoperedens sp.]
MNISVKVLAHVNPTEMQDKVEKAISNFFPVDLKLQETEIQALSGDGDLESLRTLHLRLREERILDTARKIFLNGIKDDTTRFRLNKQVACIGKLNFPPVEESLGSIHVEISTENIGDLLKVIDWLAPQTIDGKPVEEIGL